jgi:hypothetical protein
LEVEEDDRTAVPSTYGPVPEEVYQRRKKECDEKSDEETRGTMCDIQCVHDECTMSGEELEEKVSFKRLKVYQ